MEWTYPFLLFINIGIWLNLSQCFRSCVQTFDPTPRMKLAIGSDQLTRPVITYDDS